MARDRRTTMQAPYPGRGPRGRAVVSLGLPLLLVAGTLAATSGETVLVDPCGDSHTRVWVEDPDTDVSVPVPRDGHLDIAAVRVEQHTSDGALDHVAVHLDLCGDAPTAPGSGADWVVSWQVGTDCRAAVMVDPYVQMTLEPPFHELQRDIVYRMRCWSDADGPIDDEETIWQVDLEDALSFDGPTVTWTLRPGSLPAEAAATLAPGTVWRAPSASAADVPPLGVWSERAEASIAPRADRAAGDAEIVIGPADA